MPYAASDRIDFIKRSGIVPGTRILDFGGVLCEELPSAISGIASRKKISNAVMMKPTLFPFKDAIFDAVVSYHYLDLIPGDLTGFIFRDAARVLKENSIFSFMVMLWAPQNEAQKSSLLFNEILRSTGAIYSHEFTDISRELSESGFSDITVETIKRDIAIPPDFVKAHLILIASLVKKEQDKGAAGIKTHAKKYIEQVEDHGESMLPALHFTAKKI